MTREVSDALLEAIEGVENAEAAFIRDNREFLTKKSVWAFGGDGWAYDIGYGGLDHVLQADAISTCWYWIRRYIPTPADRLPSLRLPAPLPSLQQAEKETKKKDLGMMAMSYGYVYVAQVALGSDPAQTLKAIREAEAYDGPSW